MLAFSGIFSTLNTPLDISLMPKYTAICGYTEEEIVRYFPDYRVHFKLSLYGFPVIARHEAIQSLI